MSHNVNKIKAMLLMSCLAFAGCSLKNAPECFTGNEMCEPNETMGQALYSVCEDDGNWRVTRGCIECVGNQCSANDALYCSDGERFCKDYSENISISVVCKDNSYLTNVCSEGCNNDVCSSNKSKHCKIIKTS